MWEAIEYVEIESVIINFVHVNLFSGDSVENKKRFMFSFVRVARTGDFRQIVGMEERFSFQ